MNENSTLRNHTKVLWGVVAFVAIFAIATTITYGLILNKQQDTLNHIHQAEYRICVRQMVNRASIDAGSGDDEPKLPLYDCTPNLKGVPAHRMTAAEAAAFEQYVKTTPENQLP